MTLTILYIGIYRTIMGFAMTHHVGDDPDKAQYLPPLIFHFLVHWIPHYYCNISLNCKPPTFSAIATAIVFSVPPYLEVIAHTTEVLCGLYGVSIQDDSPKPLDSPGILENRYHLHK